MSQLADQTIAALRSNHDDLAARVNGFAESDLAAQSGASEWDVAQVLSHLGSGAEISLATLTAAQTGGEPLPDDFNQSVWDRWNARSRQEQADGFLRSNTELVSALEHLDEQTRNTLQVNLGFLPFPVDIALFSGMRLNEASLHAWDVRAGADPAATLPDQEAEAVLAQLIGPLGFMIGFLAKPDVLDGAEVRLRVETTNPTTAFGFVVGPSVSFGEAPGTADTDAVLTTPAEAFVRLVSGRLDAARTPDAVTITGDAITLDQLREVFPGF